MEKKRHGKGCAPIATMVAFGRIGVLATAMIIVAICGSIASTPAMANGLPLRASGGLAGEIAPATDVPVGIESEKIYIRFSERDARRPSWMTCTVSVTYVLHNSNPDLLTVPVLFIGEAPHGYGVTLDKEAVSVSPSPPVSEMGDAAGEETARIWLDPMTGKPYLFPEGVTDPNVVNPVRFTLELPPGDHVMEVTFEGRLGVDRVRYPNPISHLSYFLRPARHWAYFKDLEIVIDLPSSEYRLASTMPLKKSGGRSWTATFDALPESDLHVSVMSTDGMWLGRYTTREALWLLLAAIAFAPRLFVRLVEPRLSTTPGRVLGILLKVFATWFAIDTLTRDLLQLPLDVLVQYPLLVATLLFIWFWPRGHGWSRRRPGFQKTGGETRRWS